MARQQDLKGVDALDARSDWHDGDDATTQPRCRLVGGVIVDDDRRSALVRLGPTDRLEIDGADVPRRMDASGRRPAVVRDGLPASASPVSAHSPQAVSYAALISATRRDPIARCTAAERDPNPCSRAYSSRNSRSSRGRPHSPSYHDPTIGRQAVASVSDRARARDDPRAPVGDLPRPGDVGHDLLAEESAVTRSATRRPWRMTRTRVHTAVTCWRLWAMTSMPMSPSAAAWLIISRTPADSWTPSAAVGSSRSRRRRPQKAALAMATAWRWPPDIVSTVGAQVGKACRQAADGGPCFGLHVALAQDAQAAERSAAHELAPEEEVGGEVEALDEREVLVGRLHARVARLGRRGELVARARQVDGPRHAAARRRRCIPRASTARAVVAHEAHDLAVPEREAHVDERVDRAVALGEVLDLQERQDVVGRRRRRGGVRGRAHGRHDGLEDGGRSARSRVLLQARSARRSDRGRGGTGRAPPRRRAGRRARPPARRRSRA